MLLFRYTGNMQNDTLDIEPGETVNVTMTVGSHLNINVDGVEYSILIRRAGEIRIERLEHEITIKPRNSSCVSIFPA